MPRINDSSSIAEIPVRLRTCHFKKLIAMHWFKRHISSIDKLHLRATFSDMHQKLRKHKLHSNNYQLTAEVQLTADDKERAVKELVKALERAGIHCIEVK